MSASAETRVIEIVFPMVTNSMGVLFGGHALGLMDRLAFIVASHFARKPVVTVCSDKLEFRTRVREGNLIELIGRIGRAGRTSITVAIEKYAEDLLSGERNLCTTGQLVLVAVDSDGHPVPVSCGKSAGSVGASARDVGSPRSPSGEGG